MECGYYTGLLYHNAALYIGPQTPHNGKRIRAEADVVVTGPTPGPVTLRVNWYSVTLALLGSTTSAANCGPTQVNANGILYNFYPTCHIAIPFTQPPAGTAIAELITHDGTATATATWNAALKYPVVVVE
jgi:hypothetical protein